MKKFSIVLMAISFLLVTDFAYSQMMLQPVAVVNLTKPEMISQADLDKKIAEYRDSILKSGGSEDQVSSDDVLEIMINDLLVIQGAERDGVTVTESQIDSMVATQKANIEKNLGRTLSNTEFENFLNYYGTNLKDYRKSLKNNYIVDTYVRLKKKSIIDSAATPTETEIQSFYKKNAASFINPEYIHISHIFMSKNGVNAANAKSQMTTIAKDIKFGKISFDDAVIKYSEDDGSKFISGDIGWYAINDTTKKSTLGENFFDVVFGLPTGEISNSIESNAGYHIVKILERIDPKILTLSDKVKPDSVMTVRQYITQRLFSINQTNAYTKAVSSLIQDLRNDAEITILE